MMVFQTDFSSYQVETSQHQYHPPNKQQAELTYQKCVKQNIPCELFLNGKLQKEFKPHINNN